MNFVLRKAFVLLLPVLVCSVTASDIDNSYYTAKVKIEPGSKVSKPELKACPLYDNKEYAFSMRWDDNNKSNFRMQELMHKYGFKGTFYLNGRKGYDYKKICEKGTDGGSHSMTHPKLPDLSYNRMFLETVEIKPFIESRTDRPVNTYCFSYGAFRSMEDPYVGHGIAEMLQRAGYNFNTYSRFVERYCKKKDPVSTYRQIVPGDRNPSMDKFEKTLKLKLTDPKYKSKEPSLGIGVHVWMKSDEAWNNMENILKKYSGKKNWWYCTQSDYGAYRKLYRLGKITRIKSSGGSINYEVKLPYASDIGTDIPLTMCFNGKATEIKVNGKDVKLKYKDGKTFFNITPPTYAKTPDLISYARNSKNSSNHVPVKKTVMKPWLYVKGDNELVLTLKNSGKDKLSNIKVKYMLPIMYKHIKADRIKSIPAGGENILKKKLVTNDKKFLRAGVPFLLCQIDYLRNGKPERTYASTLGKEEIPPRSDCFRDSSVMSNLFGDFENLKDGFIKMSTPNGKRISGLNWFKAGDSDRGIYSIYTMKFSGRLQGKFRKVNRKENPFVAVDYAFNSDKAVNLILKSKWLLKKIQAVFVNGREIQKENMTKIKLQKGKNRVVMIYKPRWLYPGTSFPFYIKKSSLNP